MAYRTTIYGLSNVTKPRSNLNYILFWTLFLDSIETWRVCLAVAVKILILEVISSILDWDSGCPYISYLGVTRSLQTNVGILAR
jgi:hypothetical protein